MEKPLSQKLIKFSHKRLILSGNEVETIEYQKPYFWNFSPKPRSPSTRLGKNALEGRRNDSINRTRTKVRRLIVTNQSAYNCMPLFLTFTFADATTNITQANQKFKEFTRKLNNTLHIKTKYLVVPEFQKDYTWKGVKKENGGSVHYHVIYFNIPFIPKLYEKYKTCWGKGTVDLKSIKHIKAVSAYVSKYIRKDLGNKKLCGEKGYFTSRGILQPQEYKNENAIDNFIECANIEKVAEKQFLSDRYKLIKYTQYKKVL